MWRLPICAYLLAALLVALSSATTTQQHGGGSVVKTWTYTPSDPTWSIQNYAVISDVAFLVVGSSMGAGNITAISTASGTVFWERTLASIQCTTSYLDWVKLFADQRGLIVDCATNCNDCAFIGLNPITGSSMWRNTVYSTSELFNGVLAADGSVFYTPLYDSISKSVPTLAAIRTADGSLMWKKELDRWPERTFLTTDDVLVLCPTVLPMYAVNATNGANMWSRQYSNAGVWVFGTFVLYQDESLHLVTMRAATNQTIWGTAIAIDDVFITPNQDQLVVRSASNVSGFNLQSGRKVFSVSGNASSYFAAATLTGSGNGLVVWVEALSNQLVAIDATNGEHRLTVPYMCNFEFYTCHPPNNFAAAVGNILYSAISNATGNGVVTALNASTGFALSGPTPQVVTPGTPGVVTFGDTAVFMLHGFTAFKWES